MPGAIDRNRLDTAALLIASRRSIRRYREATIPPEVVDELLRCAVNAPSAHNRQPWRLAVLRRQDPKVRQAMGFRRIPMVAMSPIVDGAAVKGPVAKIMRESGYAPSAAEIAKLYQGIANEIVIDELDRNLSATIEAMGLRARVTATVMRSAADQVRLTQEVIAFAESIAVQSEPLNQ